jgi:hypothetical protein
MQSFATSKLMATVALAAGAASVAAFGASPAAAASTTQTPAAAQASVRNAPYIGEVIARLPLNIRAAATTNSAVLGSYAPGTIIHIKCKVNGQNIDGNPRWYKLYYRTGWVAARYVENIGAAPSWC